jgi:hypothetical protein
LRLKEIHFADEPQAYLSTRKTGASLMSSLERVTQVCLIALCVFSIFAVADRSRRANALPRSPQALAQDLVGKKVDVAGAAWDHSRVSVVIGLSSKCRFCLESMPLYRRVADLRRELGTKISLSVISPEQQANITRFLSEQNLPVDAVFRAEFTRLGVKFTPTVLIVDSRGVLRDIFVGRLTGSQQEQLLKTIALAASR